MTVGAVVSCANLQWSYSARSQCLPSVTASELSLFSCSPKQAGLRSPLERLRTHLKVKWHHRVFLTSGDVGFALQNLVTF